MDRIIEFLNSHASVRAFTDQTISKEDERTIVQTAERSPTSSNLHAYTMIGIRDRETKDELARLSGNQQHVSASSLFLVFCGDLFRLRQLNERRGYPFSGEYTEMFLIAAVDAALAASRALLAAQALGIWGVMVGGIRSQAQAVSDLLKLPDQVFPVMGMSLGYPDREPKLKPRLPLSGIYMRETYDTSALEAAVAEYDRTIAELGYLKGREVEPEKYPESTDEYTWSEHTARRMASDKPGVRRDHMMAFLQKRGLMKK